MGKILDFVSKFESNEVLKKCVENLEKIENCTKYDIDEKHLEIQLLKQKCERLQKKNDKLLKRLYSLMDDYNDLRTKHAHLSNRTKFNDDFLELIDAFVQEECPEFGWKFDVFLDKIREAK